MRWVIGTYYITNRDCLKTKRILLLSTEPSGCNQPGKTLQGRPGKSGAKGEKGDVGQTGSKVSSSIAKLPRIH